MNIFKHTNTTLLLMLTALVTNFPAAAQDKSQPVLLELSPAKCVALRQGQTCYADVVLNWQSQQPRDVCLFRLGQNAAMQCWRQAKTGKFAGEVSAQENVDFELRANASEQALAAAQLKVAWVYKKKRRTVSWRIF